MIISTQALKQAQENRGQPHIKTPTVQEPYRRSLATTVGGDSRETLGGYSVETSRLPLGQFLRGVTDSQIIYFEYEKSLVQIIFKKQRISQAIMRIPRHWSYLILTVLACSIFCLSWYIDKEFLWIIAFVIISFCHLMLIITMNLSVFWYTLKQFHFLYIVANCICVLVLVWMSPSHSHAQTRQVFWNSILQCLSRIHP